MCRLAWQLLGMLGNVLDMLCNVLGILCNVLGMLATSLASSACIFARSYESHIKEKPPHLLSYKLWSQGSSVLLSFRSSVVHYSLGFTAYKAASWGGFLRCGTLRTLQKCMPRTPRTLQACLGCCKACQGRPRMLPSMPRSCQASLHILDSHNLKIKLTNILKINLIGAPF